MKILFTGGTGLVGSNVLPLLRDDYEIVAPSRNELNVLDQYCVEKYIIDNNIQIVIHSANPNGVKNKLDKSVNMVEGSLRCFMNFYRLRNRLSKLIYIGSGAELDKSLDMDMITEKDFDRSIPMDEYGFAKYIMNDLALQSENVYNLRLFACYGPGDYPTKFITHCIDSINEGKKSITIRQDCYFDYIQVFDLAKIIPFFLNQRPKYHDYNISSGQCYKLSEIAQMVKQEMISNIDIEILNEGLNRSYTASNKRLMNEMPDLKLMDIKEGIKIQIESQMKR